jgi:hypothetical protein
VVETGTICSVWMYPERTSVDEMLLMVMVFRVGLVGQFGYM